VLCTDESLLDRNGISKAGMASREMDVKEIYFDDEVRHLAFRLLLRGLGKRDSRLNETKLRDA